MALNANSPISYKQPSRSVVSLQLSPNLFAASPVIDHFAESAHEPIGKAYLSPQTVEKAAVVVTPEPADDYTSMRAISPRSSKSTEVLKSYTCPITEEYMNDPVSLSDGFNYERRAIIGWLQHNSLSPTTRAPLKNKGVKPNHALKAAIQQHRDLHLQERLASLRLNKA